MVSGKNVRAVSCVRAQMGASPVTTLLPYVCANGGAQVRSTHPHPLYPSHSSAETLEENKGIIKLHSNPEAANSPAIGFDPEGLWVEKKKKEAKRCQFREAGAVQT